MAKTPPPQASSTTKPHRQPHHKNPTISKTSKISKRPLLHPPPSAQKASSQSPKTIYVSNSSPFISIVKRVRNHLSAIENRAAQSEVALGNGVNGNGNGNRNTRGTGKAKGPRIEDGEKAFLGAVERGVRNGNGDGGVRGEEVTVKATGKAIEKLLRIAVFFQGQEDVVMNIRTGSAGAVDDVLDEEGEESSRVRRVSCLEVGVRLR